MDLHRNYHQSDSYFNTEVEMTDAMKECLDNCLRCHKVCEQLIPHCLSLGGPHAERDHIQKLELCAEICRTAARFMMWNSQYHHQVCRVCAEVCLECAEDCARMQDDAMMRECAEVCRKCADTCSSMALN